MPAKKTSKKSSTQKSRRQADLQARGHVHTREAHATELAEDYVEVIADLIDEKGEARAVDIASRLGVTHVTVSKKVSRLIEDGLVTSEPYRSVFLTDKGWKIASQSRERHQIVIDFLTSLGISYDVACKDAEGIEHHVSSETLAAFKKFTK